MSDKSFQELKALFEGKRVIAVEPPNAEEAIAKFTLDDGIFRLHATELGFWIEKTNAEGQPFPSLDAILLQYSHNQWACGGAVEPKVLITRDRMTLTTPDHPDLFVHIPSLAPWEQALCRLPEASSLFSDAALCGLFWHNVFKGSIQDH